MEASTGKLERKIVEKNRRNNMKTLYANLSSLLPNHGFKEGVYPLPDQIEAAEKYIKSLKEHLEKSKAKKESLLSSSRKRAHSCISNSSSSCSSISSGNSNPKPLQIEIQDMGAGFSSILVKGIDDWSCFYEVIEVLDEECAEVVQASFSSSGNSIFHVLHEMTGELQYGFGATRISKRLEQLMTQGASCSEEGEAASEQGSWDFEIEPDSFWI